ncbi:MAG: hypothetical protein D6788_04070 [Planctomycetota bacterium]|nr:MAG: hypothetical protein D6788_04070 [Planctomycetota bacterium]
MDAMNGHARMSPLTALILGVFGVLGVIIVAGTAVAVVAVNSIDTSVAQLTGLVDGTVSGVLDNLPEALDTLPETFEKILNDRRDPPYADRLEIEARWAAVDGAQQPVITVVNHGDKVVSMLAVRLAFLDQDGNPHGEWTELAATPVAMECEDLRGPLFPGRTRYVTLSGGCCGHRRPPRLKDGENLAIAVEIAELRVWNGYEQDGGRTALAVPNRSGN